MITETKIDVAGSFTREAFEAHLATQQGAPAWWLDRKRAAYDHFASLPLPRRTDEGWRFSNIAGVKLDSTFSIGGSALEIQAPSLPAGVIVCSLTEALARHSDLLRAHFMSQPQKLGSEKFAALHVAFVTKGTFVYVPKGVTLTQPVVARHSASGGTSAIFPHTLVVAEENAQVTVVDHFKSTDAGDHFACGANDLYASHGAKLTYVATQDWSRDTLSFQLNSTVVRRDARVQSLNVHLGGKQSRHESLSQLQAPGAFSEMLALTVAEDTQEFDQRTLQIHQAPNTKSDLLYKNALRDKAKTIFSGLIIVDPDAQKTDAYQSNRNLMLSDDAEANSLPGLEIQANDVRCTHGATSSRIDPEQEFYLQARGIPKTVADELLTFGFFEEVLNRLENDELHASIRDLIATKFKKMNDRNRTLSREVTATQIPSGDKVPLTKGTKVMIHQTLGGNYTVQTDFGLFRIDAKDADTLGEKVASSLVTNHSSPADGSPDPEAIWDQLRQVFDPEIPVNIVDLGLVYSMDIEKKPEGAHKVNVAMTLTAPGCGMGPAIAEDAKSKILLVPGVADADVRITWEPPWNQQMISEEGKMKLGLI